MIRKGAKANPAKAASIANAILASSGDEGVAIATALKHVNNPKAKPKHKRLFPG